MPIIIENNKRITPYNIKKLSGRLKTSSVFFPLMKALISERIKKKSKKEKESPDEIEYNGNLCEMLFKLPEKSSPGSFTRIKNKANHK